MDKIKNDTFSGRSSLGFVALWAASYGLSWWITITYIQQAKMPPGDNNLVGILGVFVISAVIQVLITENILKRSMRGWTRYTLLGIVITFVVFILKPGFSSPYQTISMTALLLFMPVSIIQTFWLWPRVKSAWLWPLAGIAAGFVFALPMRSSSANIWEFVMASLIYGVIQGSVIRYLWMQPKDSEKSNIVPTQEESIEDGSPG